MSQQSKYTRLRQSLGGINALIGHCIDDALSVGPDTAASDLSWLENALCEIEIHVEAAKQALQECSEED